MKDTILFQVIDFTDLRLKDIVKNNTLQVDYVISQLELYLGLN